MIDLSKMESGAVVEFRAGGFCQIYKVSLETPLSPQYPIGIYWIDGSYDPYTVDGRFEAGVDDGRDIVDFVNTPEGANIMDILRYGVHHF